jgi:glutaredoxin-like protein NrdH
MTSSTTTLTVYSKPNCVQCNATYRSLDKAGVEYDVVDITLDPDARGYAMSLGHLSAPVVVVTKPDGAITSWGGYSPDSIKAFVETYRVEHPAPAGAVRVEQLADAAA